MLRRGARSVDIAPSFKCPNYSLTGRSITFAEPVGVSAGAHEDNGAVTAAPVGIGGGAHADGGGAAEFVGIGGGGHDDGGDAAPVGIGGGGQTG